MLKKTTPLLISAVLLLGACSASGDKMEKSEPALRSLAGSEWSPDIDSEVFVQFRDKGEIRGYGGCNNFHGTYEQNGEHLKISHLASTRKACIGMNMENESAFMKVFESVDHFKATHTRLELFDEDGNNLFILQRRDWD